MKFLENIIKSKQSAMQKDKIQNIKFFKFLIKFIIILILILFYKEIAAHFIFINDFFVGIDNHEDLKEVLEDTVDF